MLHVPSSSSGPEVWLGQPQPTARAACVARIPINVADPPLTARHSRHAMRRFATCTGGASSAAATVSSSSPQGSQPRSRCMRAPWWIQGPLVLQPGRLRSSISTHIQTLPWASTGRSKIFVGRLGTISCRLDRSQAPGDFFNHFFACKESRVSVRMGISFIPACFWALRAPKLVYIPSSTAQGGGGSFKNRKLIGEIGCCESGMAERIHWWTERCLRSPLFLSLSLTIYLPTYLLCIYLSIYRSISLSVSFI